MFAKLKARLAEGSSWGGIAAALGTLGTQIPAPYNAGAFSATAVAAIVAVLLKDKGSAS